MTTENTEPKEEPKPPAEEEPTRREERQGFDWEAFVKDQGEQLSALASATASPEERGTVQAAIANAESILTRVEALLPPPA